MKRSITLMLVFTVLAGLLSGCAGVAFAQSATPVAGVNTEPRTISVNGTGTATLTPDIAYINIGVHTEGKDAAAAVSGNSTSTQQVIDSLKKGGVDAKDIQTTNFSIYPQQQYDASGKQTGEVTYLVDNTVNVTVRKLDKIGELLNTAVKAGANSINGIQFDVADRAAAMSAARKAAVTDARARADELAKAAGVTVGMVMTISESSYSSPSPMYRSAYAAQDAAAPVPVEAGQMVVTVDVSVTYAIQ